MYYDSDLEEDKDDYLLKGLSAAKHVIDLPEKVKHKIEKQKAIAKKQGSRRYIAPVIGKKYPIIVDPVTYNSEQYGQRKHYGVEMYKWDNLN